jgi:hypothetical protein
MKENYVKSNYSETWLENGIIIQNIDPKVNEVNFEVAKQLVNDRQKAAGSTSKMMPVMVIANNAVNINKEAKKYYEEEEPYINIKAIAMIMDNFITSFIVNLVFVLKKNPVPTEVFNNTTKALKWLEKYKEKE